MSRHVYRPPRGKLSMPLALIGGLAATLLVFLAVPLSQKLGEIFKEPEIPEAEELTIEPPEIDVPVEEPPEPEPEEEPEPEDLEQPTDLDLGMDLADLPTGTGGGFVLDVPNFGIRDGGDSLFGGDLDQPPQPVAKFPPNYPRHLLKRGVGGRVMVALIVDAAGKILETKIRESSGHGELDAAAISAVNRWRFKPAIRSGKEVKAMIVVPFSFEAKKN